LVDGAELSEVNGNHLTILNGGGKERRLPFDAGNIVVGRTRSDRGRGGWCAKRRLHLLLAHAGLNLLEIVVMELMAALGDGLGAGAERQRDQRGQRRRTQPRLVVWRCPRDAN